MKRLSGHSEAGSAATELALSTAIIIPMMFYGMYVSEVSHVQSKVLEAEMSAAWDATAFRYHDFRNGASWNARYSPVLGDLNSKKVDQYKDFNSWGGGSGAGLSLPMSAANLTSLNCENDTSLVVFPGVSTGNRLYNRGVIRCQANARVNNTLNPRIPLLNNPRVIPPELLHTVVTGVVNSSNPLTKKGLYILTDDWGLENNSQMSSADPYQSMSENPQYYNAGQEVFQVRLPSGGSWASAKATVDSAMGNVMYYGGDQGMTDMYRRGYRSPNDTVSIGYTDEGPTRGVFTGYDSDTYSKRASGTYLGHKDPYFNSP